MRKGKILKIKTGYNPNSSSIGIEIGVFIWSSLILSILLSIGMCIVMWWRMRRIRK